MYQSGGAERVTHMLAHSLMSTRDVTVITLVGNTFPQTEYNQVSLGFSHSKLSKLFSFLYGPILLGRYCKRNDIELVISHMERANFIALISKKITKIKTICVVHNSKYLTKIKNKIGIFLLYPSANKIITVSKGIEKQLTSLFALQNVQTIYNSFDFEEIKEKIHKTLNQEDNHLFEQKKYTFITVGRLVEQKGHDVLIQSFAEAKIENSQLIIFG